MSNLMFLLYKSRACSVYLRELIIFTVISHCLYIHCKSIKSIDDNLYKKIIDAKIKQNYKLCIRYTSEDKRVWRYCNSNDSRSKDGFNFPK